MKQPLAIIDGYTRYIDSIDWLEGKLFSFSYTQEGERVIIFAPNWFDDSYHDKDGEQYKVIWEVSV